MIPKSLYIIFILALAVRFLWGGLFILNTYGDPETFEYEEIANNMLSGRGFSYTFYGMDWKAFTQPLYPVVTALVYYLAGQSQIAMLAIQCIMSSLLCFVVYFIAVRFTGIKEALLASAMTSFHPGLIVYSTLKLHTLIFDVFFYLLSISCLLRFIKKPGITNAILCGSVMGLALLSRSTILIFIIFVLAYAFFILKSINPKTRLRYIMTLCLFLVLIYSPWVIRNYMVFDDLVFMQTTSGENLWAGNNEMASGSAILPSGKSIHTAMPEEMRRDLERLDELGQVRYYKDYFKKFVKKRPLLFARLFAKKFYYFWWFGPHTGALYPRAWLYAYKVYYGILVVFFIIGVISALRKGGLNMPVLVILFAYMLSLASLHAAANVDTRHRWTVEPIVIVFASIGFFQSINYKQKKIT